MKVSDPLFNRIRRKLFLMGFFKIPMLGRLRPRLVSIDSSKVIIKIKLRRRSMNHLKSMYFGAMAVGADCASGLHAFYYAEKYHKKISFVFKSMSAEFIKRLTTDATFTFDDGDKIREIIEKSAQDGIRYNQMCTVTVTNNNSEIVSIFKMEASVKVLS